MFEYIWHKFRKWASNIKKTRIKNKYIVKISVGPLIIIENKRSCKQKKR